MPLDDSRRLAIMGARAVLDLGASRMLGANPSNFSAGMQKLVDDKRLTENERKLIDAAFDAGSAAMHRSHQPEVDEVRKRGMNFCGPDESTPLLAQFVVGTLTFIEKYVGNARKSSLI